MILETERDKLYKALVVRQKNEYDRIFKFLKVISSTLVFFCVCIYKNTHTQQGTE